MSEGARITCDVCHRKCALKEGQAGACLARKNDDGVIKSLNYGIITGMALDPIEKKPLKNFFPGSHILSVGSFGCNLKCGFCQNHEISQTGEELKKFYEKLTPGELCDTAVQLAGSDKKDGSSFKEDKVNIGVAYTYNEPLIGWEFVYDTAKPVHEAGLKNVLVTNGCISTDILKKLLPYIDAMNIDLKCFTDEGYESIGGDLETVKSFIEYIVRYNRNLSEKDSESHICHIELTSLIVPGLNDSMEAMEREADYIASLDKNIPLHITRYFPCYKAKEPPTDISLMHSLRDIAAKRLKYVYLGNV